ncbi:MAG: OmpA family protein [Yoonia sp.]|uniref:OmpA family protein n=1 Tax=Yoonia sp. TaxID=2212373 RepID=UPI003EF2E9E0
MIRIFTVFALCVASVAQAQTLTFPSNATLQQEIALPLESHVYPVDIWDRGEMPTRVIEGALTRQAWRIDASFLTTLQLLRPLREQLRNDGYQVIFECQTEACGGFDFRFAIDTLAPPQMQINIGDFRYLAATRDGADGDEFLGLLVSRTAQAGFVQITHVSPASETGTEIATVAEPAAPPEGVQPDDPLPDQLETIGRAILKDLTFATGSAQLADGEYASLAALAEYLVMNRNRVVALVGHTDASGALDVNVALSKRRAASVLERLVTRYDIPRRQLEAEGVGYLAPLASNLTGQGRQANRRVEAVIVSGLD